MRIFETKKLDQVLVKLFVDEHVAVSQEAQAAFDAPPLGFVLILLVKLGFIVTDHTTDDFLHGHIRSHH